MTTISPYPQIASWLQLRGLLLLPLLFALWMAWTDLSSRRIPNYLTLVAAVSGLAFQGFFHGLPGLLNGFLGMLLGFGLLFIPYCLKGMGAGDVKALAALGAWLGPQSTFFLFLFMGVAGGLLALGHLVRRGLLGAKLRQARIHLVNWMLSRPFGSGPQAAAAARTEDQGIPYGVALAAGMLAVFGWGK